jgi:hypothetical protein
MADSISMIGADGAVANITKVIICQFREADSFLSLNRDGLAKYECSIEYGNICRLVLALPNVENKNQPGLFKL